MCACPPHMHAHRSKMRMYPPLNTPEELQKKRQAGEMTFRDASAVFDRCAIVYTSMFLLEWFLVRVLTHALNHACTPLALCVCLLLASEETNFGNILSLFTSTHSNICAHLKLLVDWPLFFAFLAVVIFPLCLLYNFWHRNQVQFVHTCACTQVLTIHHTTASFFLCFRNSVLLA